MAHMIDMSNGMANMAYKGATPWHGLGQSLAQGASIEEWTKAAGLEWQAMLAQVAYNTGNGNTEAFEGQNVLYRSDTLAPLGLVSDRYKPVQPAAIMDFFKQLSDAAGFELETAGSLRGGAQVWAMAKVSEGVEIAQGDVVRPYVLLATSYDGSLATMAKFTTVRVVCNNTLTMAARDGKSTVKIRHSTAFDPARISERLHEIDSTFPIFAQQAQSLSNAKINADDADGLLLKILGANEDVAPLMQNKIEADKGESLLSLIAAKDGAKDSEDLRKSKEYRKIMELYNGKTIGAELLDGNNKWGLLNAVTEYVDHARVKNADRRMQAAWFGVGDDLKTTALQTLLTS